MPAPTAAGFQLVAEWAGHKTDIRLNSDKIWAAAYTDSGVYLAVWGRRGTAYQEQTRPCGSKRAAAAWFDAKVSEKVRKGYVAVPFGDRHHGAIPSFGGAATGGAAGAAVGSAGPRITVAGVVAQLVAVARALGRARDNLPDLIFAFTQIRLTAALLLDHAPLDDDERIALAAALAAARSAVQQALVA